MKDLDCNQRARERRYKQKQVKGGGERGIGREISEHTPKVTGESFVQKTYKIVLPLQIRAWPLPWNK